MSVLSILAEIALVIVMAYWAWECAVMADEARRADREEP